MTHKMSLRQRWQQTSLPNKLMIGASLLMAFGTLFYAAVAVFQYRMMREQSETTKAQLKAMQQQSETVQGQLNTMQAQADIMRDSVNQQRKSVGQTETLIGQQKEALSYGQRSAVASEAGIKQSGEALRLEQRPIVTVNWIRLKENVKAGEKTTVVISIINSGRTPAVKTVWVKHIGFSPSDEPPNPIQASGLPSVAVLSPNVESSGEFSTDHPITAQEMQLLELARFRLYVWGSVEYKDLFGNKYRTEFCAYNQTLRTGESGKFFVCAKGDTFR